jgi:arylsulfatase A-like enzyme
MFRTTASRLNIAFMFMDNLGYGEPGVCSGGILGVSTPRIAKLASEHTRLLNFKVEAQCTPTRSALMTDRLPIRSGTYEVPLGGIPGRADAVGALSRSCCPREDTLLPLD